MTALEVTAGDVMGALREQNVQIAGGRWAMNSSNARSPPQNGDPLKGRLSEPDQFENIIVKTDKTGRVTRPETLRGLNRRAFLRGGRLSFRRPAVALVAFKDRDPTPSRRRPASKRQ